MSRTQSRDNGRSSDRTPSGADPYELSRFVVPLPPKGSSAEPDCSSASTSEPRGPLTLVTAPAGTGKTVLVSSWAAAARAVGTVVWLSLDADSAPACSGTSWRPVCRGAASTCRPRCRRPARTPVTRRTRPRSPGKSGPPRTRRAHPRLRRRPGGAVATKLDSLIHRSAGQLRVVLRHPEDPLLPLHRYRLAETIVELRMADLAFTAAEARELLTGTGVDLSAAGMDAVTGRTQGWAAGLRMAAMSLAHRADREDAARELAGNTGTVAEYLLAEVLDTQPQGCAAAARDQRGRRPAPGTGDCPRRPPRRAGAELPGPRERLPRGAPELPGCYRYHRSSGSCCAPSWPTSHRTVRSSCTVSPPPGWPTTVWSWRRSATRSRPRLGGRGPLRRGRPVDPTSADRDLRQSRCPRRSPESRGGTAGVSVVAAARATAAATAGCRGETGRPAAGPRPGEPWPAAELALSRARPRPRPPCGDVETAVDAAAATGGLSHRRHRGRGGPPELPAVIQSDLGAALALAGRLNAAAAAFAVGRRLGTRRRERPLIEALGQGALLAAFRGDLRWSADLAARAVRVSSAAGLTPACSPAAAEVALAYVHIERYDVAAARRHAARAAGCEHDQRTRCRGDARPHSCPHLPCRRRPRRRRAHLDAPASGGGLPDWLADILVLEKVSLLVADGQSARAAISAKAVGAEAPRGRTAEPEVPPAQRPDAPAHLPGASASCLRVDTLCRRPRPTGRHERRAVTTWTRPSGSPRLSCRGVPSGRPRDCGSCAGSRTSCCSGTRG